VTGFFAFTKEGDAYVWPVEPLWCSYNGLYGGTLLGLAIEALEDLSGRPIRALSASFLGGVQEGEVLRLEPAIRVSGRATSQAEVSVWTDRRPVMDAGAVMGLVPEEMASGLAAPSADPPEDCPPRLWRMTKPGGLQEALEARVAHVDPYRVAFWVRCLGAGNAPLSPSLIAVAADHPGLAVTLATQGSLLGITLNASMQFVETPADCRGDTWLLVDTQFDAMGNNVAMARARVWLGQALLATCEQTLRLRSMTQTKAAG
jgi:acyl-CoA thioesterase